MTLPRGTAPWIAAIGCAALALQAANLLYVARSQGCESVVYLCPVGSGNLAGAPDSESYLSLSRSIAENGFLATDFYTRPPGYPLALAGVTAVFGDPMPVLWLGLLLAAAAAAATAWMGALFSGRRAGVLAGLLVCAWPHAYQYQPLILSDALHASLTVLALAATLRWRCSESLPFAALSGALWLAAQSVRSTFLALPALVPILLWRTPASRRYVVASLVLWGATMVMPAFTVGNNWLRHGVVLPPQACYAVPRLKAELGWGTFQRIRAACLEDYHRAPLRRARLDREFLAKHSTAAAMSMAAEVARQMLTPPLKGRQWAELYPRAMKLSVRYMMVHWLVAAVAVIWLARRRPQDALFLVGLGALVMLPAANVTWVGGRIRLPVDLVFLPVIGAFVVDAAARILERGRTWGRSMRR